MKFNWDNNRCKVGIFTLNLWGYHFVVYCGVSDYPVHESETHATKDEAKRAAEQWFLSMYADLTKAMD